MVGWFPSGLAEPGVTMHVSDQDKDPESAGTAPAWFFFCHVALYEPRTQRGREHQAEHRLGTLIT